MRRGERRSEQKRREILSAARALFVTEGYADTGMEIVARQAAVSTATLYAHFPSKADLFRTAVDDMVAEVAAGVSGGQGKGDARARLTAFARAYANFCASPATRAVLRIVCAERRRFAESVQTAEARANNDIGGAAIRLISDLQAEGAISVDKPSRAASQLLGMIEHPTLLYGLIRGDDVQPQCSVKEICEDAVVTFLARYGVRGKAG